MGQFTIIDFANILTKEKYHIRFGDTEQMLSSSCHIGKNWLSLQTFFHARIGTPYHHCTEIPRS